jgi:hypothetical protein
VRKLVEQEEVLAPVPDAGHAEQQRDPQVRHAKKVPHLLLATGRHQVGDPKNYPWTLGFNLSYQAEGRSTPSTC